MDIPKTLSKQDQNSIARGLLTSALVIGAVLVVQKSAETLWAEVTDEPPPNNPAQKGVSWPRALAWAAFVGVSVGVARAAARRWATTRV